MTNVFLFQITRGNLNGGQHEPLPIVTLARELNIDSINAYLYWSNGHSVECARLNGAERRPYYSGQLFSGKQGKKFAVYFFKSAMSILRVVVSQPTLYCL